MYLIVMNVLNLNRDLILLFPQESNAIGSKHNANPRPFLGAALGGGKVLVNTQYNTPAALYSKTNYEDTLSAHTEVIAPGVKG